eukprot:scaffold21158_cov71-Cyclotella_meneghiniana.AAC.12
MSALAEAITNSLTCIKSTDSMTTDSILAAATAEAIAPPGSWMPSKPNRMHKTKASRPPLGPRKASPKASQIQSLRMSMGLPRPSTSTGSPPRSSKPFLTGRSAQGIAVLSF